MRQDTIWRTVEFKQDTHNCRSYSFPGDADFWKTGSRKMRRYEKNAGFDSPLSICF